MAFRGTGDRFTHAPDGHALSAMDLAHAFVCLECGYHAVGGPDTQNALNRAYVKANPLSAWSWPDMQQHLLSAGHMGCPPGGGHIPPKIIGEVKARLQHIYLDQYTPQYLKQKQNQNQNQNLQQSAVVNQQQYGQQQRQLIAAQQAQQHAQLRAERDRAGNMLPRMDHHQQQQQYQQQQHHHHQAYWTMRPMLPGQPMLPPHQAQYGAMFAVATAANLNMAVSTAATMAGSPMPLLPVPPRLGGYGHPVTNAPLAASQRDFPTLAAAAAAQRRPAPIAAPTTDTDSLPPTVTTDGMPQAAPELHAFAATQPKAVWRTQGSHHRELFKVLNESNPDGSTRQVATMNKHGVDVFFTKTRRLPALLNPLQAAERPAEVQGLLMTEAAAPTLLRPQLPAVDRMAAIQSLKSDGDSDSRPQFGRVSAGEFVTRYGVIANQDDVTLLSVRIISETPDDIINQKVTIRLLSGQSTDVAETKVAAGSVHKTTPTPSGGDTPSGRQGTRHDQQGAPIPLPLELPAVIGGGGFAEFELELEAFGLGATDGWLVLEFETARSGHLWEWSSQQFAIARNMGWCVVGEETALNPLMDTFVPAGWRAFDRPTIGAGFGPCASRQGGCGLAQTFDCSKAVADAGQASFGGGSHGNARPYVFEVTPVEKWMPVLRKNMLAAVGTDAWLAPDVQQMSADALMDARQVFSIQYRAKMHAMLVLEELQHIRDIRRFDLFNVRIRPKANRSKDRRPPPGLPRSQCSEKLLMANLKVPGLVEKRISVNMNDRLLLRRAHRDPRLGHDEVNARIPFDGQIPLWEPPSSFVQYGARVHNYEGDTALVALDTPMAVPLDPRVEMRDEAWFVRFFHNKEVFEFMHDAIDNVPRNVNASPWIWPVGNVTEDEQRALRSFYAMPTDADPPSAKSMEDAIAAIDWHFVGLNLLQQTAVVNIITPGLACREPHLIFGPPGTGKTMTVVEAAWQLLRTVPGSRILMVAPSNAAADVLCDRLRQMGMPPSELHRFNWRNRKADFVLPTLLPYCNQNPQTGELDYIELPLLMSKRVVVCTCFASAVLRQLAGDQSEGMFSHVFIDEAAQALEAEALIPLSLVGPGCKVVLSGDPCQLGAVVRCPSAAESGLAVSLMERLMVLPLYVSNELGRYVTALRNNYRSHIRILQLSSDLFYTGSLLACANPTVVDKFCNWDGLKDLDFPMVVYEVEGQCVCAQDSLSPLNAAEANAVADVVASLMASGIALSLADFGVMAPFRKQVTKIRKVLRSRGYGVVRVGTIDDYQGQEALVTIISTVISDGWVPDSVRDSFFGDPKRFNVAISRGKGLCVIVGNPHYLAQSKYWNAAVDYCRNAGAKVLLERPGETDVDASPVGGPVGGGRLAGASARPRPRLLGQAAAGWHSAEGPDELHENFRSMELEWQVHF